MKRAVRTINCAIVPGQHTAMLQHSALSIHSFSYEQFCVAFLILFKGMQYAL